MSDGGIIHIVYATDINYAPMLGVSLTSLLDNNQEERFQIHILDSGIEEEDIAKIEALCKRYQQPKPRFIPAEDVSAVLGIDVAADRGSLTQYARIFISRHIDPEIDRVLYLDCDTIVRKSISPLWNLELEGATIGALDDAFSVHYRKNLDLKPDDIMFNSGVMLIDMKKWRERNVEQRILDFIRNRRGFVEKGDQGALTAVLSRETMCFDTVYNAITIFFDFSYEEMIRYRRPPRYYSEADVKRAVEDPVIIHYTLSFLSKRPWMEGCEHPWVEEWLKYKAMSPWKDMPLTEEHRSWRVTAIRKLPRRFMMWLAGLLQVYGRPWLYRIRLRKLQ